MADLLIACTYREKYCCNSIDSHPCFHEVSDVFWNLSLNIFSSLILLDAGESNPRPKAPNDETRPFRSLYQAIRQEK